VTRLCQDTNGGATGVLSGLRPQIPFLPLVKHSSKELDVFRTLARVPERSKYRKAAYRPDAKWSAAAGWPTSPHLNQNSSPVRFSAVSNGHFEIQVVCRVPFVLEFAFIRNLIGHTGGPTWAKYISIQEILGRFESVLGLSVVVSWEGFCTKCGHIWFKFHSTNVQTLSRFDDQI